jgi:hypothetical protein
MAFHPFVTPNKILQIGYLVWILGTRIQMNYTSIDTRNKGHTRVETSKVRAFKFLEQRLVKVHRDSIAFGNTCNKVQATILTFKISFLATMLALTVFFVFEPFGLNKLFVILRLPLSACGAINCFIVSLCATIAKPCCITLLSDTGGSLRSSFAALPLKLLHWRR